MISSREDGSGAAGSFGHVGIYLGNGQMIHAPRPGKSVEIVQLKGLRCYEQMAWSIRCYGRDGVQPVDRLAAAYPVGPSSMGERTSRSG